MEDWDEYFMNIARQVRVKSSNNSTKVGCVIVDTNKTIITSGFNDFPMETDLSFVTMEKPVCYLIDIHAEMNAIINSGRSLKGCTCYVTNTSCDNCFKHLIVAGIREVVYDELFTNSKSTATPERIEAVLRLIKMSGVQQRNMKGQTFVEDLKANGYKIAKNELQLED